MNTDYGKYDTIGAAAAVGNVTVSTPDGAEGNPFLKYLGQPNQPFMQNIGDLTKVDRHDLPALYANRPNPHLLDIVEGSMFNKTESWYMKALPVRRIDDPNFSYNKWTFDKYLVGHTPHEGVSRVVESSEQSYSGKAERFGLGIVCEVDHFNTPEGQRRFLFSIEQVRSSVEMTNNYHALAALLQTPRFIRAQERLRKTTLQTTAQLMDFEKSNYGIVQKSADGLKILVQRMIARMNDVGVEPDMIAIPRPMELYLTMVAPDNVSFQLKGDRGPNTFEQGPSGISRQLGGLPVYKTDTFMAFKEQKAPIDLLLRESITSNYFLMTDRSNDTDHANYKSSHRDVTIYDANSDSLKKIGLKAALRNSFRFDEDGELHPDHYTALHGQDGRHKRDMFAYRGNDGTLKVCAVLGQMEEDYLDDKTIRRMVAAIIGAGVNDAEAYYRIIGVENIVDAGERVEGDTNADLEGIRQRITAQGCSLAPFDKIVGLIPDNELTELINRLPADGDVVANKTAYNKLKKCSTKRHEELAETLQTAFGLDGRERAGSNESVNAKAEGSAFAAPKRTKTLQSSINDLMSSNIGALASSNRETFDENNAMYAVNMESPALQARLVKAGAGDYGNENAAEIARLLLTSKINLALFEGMIDYDIPVPFGFICFRPVISVNTYSMIMLKSGCGFTAIGHNNMMGASEVDRKMIRFHYTYYSGSRVTDEKSILVADDVMYNGYRGGYNDKFMTEQDITVLSQNLPQFTSDMDRNSIIACMIPVTEKQMDVSPVSMYGYYEGEARRAEKTHYTSADYYTTRLNLNIGSMPIGNVSHQFTERFLSETNKLPSFLAYQDMHKFWVNGGMNGHVFNKGHFGDQVYPRFRKLLDGDLTSLAPPNIIETIA